MRDYARQGDHVIVPRSGSGVIRVALLVAILTSAGWYAQLLKERDTHQQQILAEQIANERLLAEAVARMTPIRSLTIQYRNGASATVNFIERQP